MLGDKLPRARVWHDIGSDVNWSDHGGLWARRIDATRYHVIRFENCADWGDGASGYHCDLQEVTLDAPADQLQGALSYVGLDPSELATFHAHHRALAIVQALSSYGAYAPLWQSGGKNAHALLRAAKSESRSLEQDAAEYQARMERPVNRIGSTAREYQAGDTSSAILRGLAAGDPAADIMARMGMLQVVKVG